MKTTTDKTLTDDLQQALAEGGVLVGTCMTCNPARASMIALNCKATGLDQAGFMEDLMTAVDEYLQAYPEAERARAAGHAEVDHVIERPYILSLAGINRIEDDGADMRELIRDIELHGFSPGDRIIHVERVNEQGERYTVPSGVERAAGVMAAPC